MMQELMNEVRRQSETIQLLTANIFESRKKLLSDEVKELGTDKIFAMRFDNCFQEEEVVIPWYLGVFKGVRLTLDWIWDDTQKTILVKESAYAPLYEVLADDDEVLRYESLFIKPIK